MAAGGHITFARFAGLDVDDTVEEIGFTVLATEVLVPSSNSRSA
jgi:hypothetical protein